MIKYFEELENRKNYYLPLVKNDTEKLKVFDYKLTISFIEKYKKLFDYGEILVNKFKKYSECENRSEYESILEDLYPVLDDFKKIEVSSSDIENYFLLIKKIIIFLRNETGDNSYSILEHRFMEALNEINDMKTIIVKSGKTDNLYLTDSWFITPTNKLYNAGPEGHKGTNLVYAYEDVKDSIYKGKTIDKSKYYLSVYRDIIEKKYITEEQFKTYLNFISQPVYSNYIIYPKDVKKIDGVNVTHEKRIVDIVAGVVISHRLFYKFFEDLMNFSNNPKKDLDTLIDLTRDFIPDILIRCCGFHKIDSKYNRSIITSCLNYEKILEEYIVREWNISFLPPIILDKGELKEYPKEYIIARSFR